MQCCQRRSLRGGFQSFPVVVEGEGGVAGTGLKTTAARAAYPPATPIAAARATPPASLVLIACALLHWVARTSATRSSRGACPCTLTALLLSAHRTLALPLHWSTWRRRHQYRARQCHYQRPQPQWSRSTAAVL